MKVSMKSLALASWILIFLVLDVTAPLPAQDVGRPGAETQIEAAIALAEQAASAPEAESPIWRDRIASRRTEIAAALSSLISADRAADAMRLTAAMGRFWNAREARDWYRQVLAIPSGKQVAERIPLLLAASLRSFQLGDQTTTRRWAQEALDLARRTGDKKRMSSAYFRLSQVELRKHDLRAFHRANDTMLSVCREMGDERCEVNVRNMKGEAARGEGNLQLAAEMNEQNLAFGTEHNVPSVIRSATFNLAFIDLARGRTTDVRKRLGDALPLFRAAQAEGTMSVVIAGMAMLAHLEHDPEHAARLLGASAAKLESLGTIPDPADQDQIRRFTERVRRELGGRAFRAAFDAGKKLPFEQALEEAMRLGQPALGSSP